MRFRSTIARALALTVATGLTTVACGQYSISNIRALKAFKDANQLYGKNDYEAAIEKYQEVFQRNPEFSAITYFFLANSYDNLYKPTRKGEPQNDQYIVKAIENYKLAIQKIKDTDQEGPLIRKRSYEYLIAAYKDKLKDFQSAEPIAQQLIQMEPNEPSNYQMLGSLYEEAGRYDEAEAMFIKSTEVKPGDGMVWAALGGYYNRQGQFEKTMTALNKRAETEPNNPEAWHTIGTYYEDKLFQDKGFVAKQPAKAKEYSIKGIEAEDKALAINPEYFEALSFKNILLRMEAGFETDLAKRKKLLDEAEVFYNRAMAAQKKQGTVGTAGTGKKGK
jgi:tetratricopeptide (TPR) repeat protein